MLHRLSDLDVADPDLPVRVGGKAIGLALLLQAGEVAPEGFVVPHDGVESLEPADLEVALAELGSARVAVRSSGVGEDHHDRSLAGANLTLLDVPAESGRVAEAAVRVHRSGERVAVVVQPMVDARVSGVAFSVNPVTGSDDCVISAVTGPGEALVAGRASGETWVVGVDGVDGAGGLLDVTRVAQIAETARRLAQARGHPVDVEWSIDAGTDGLVLLQCRPATAVPVEPTYRVPPGPWEKDVTHSPGPLSPMTISLQITNEEMFDAWAERFGLVIKSLRIAHFGGEEYSQVVPLTGDPAKPGSNPPWWLLGAVARIHPALRRRMRTAKRVLRSDRLAELCRSWEHQWKDEFERLCAELGAAQVSEMSDGELIAHGEHVKDRLHRGTRIHFDVFVPYLVGVHEFVRTAGDLLGWDSTRCLAALAGHSPASRSLAAVVDRLRAVPDAADAVDRAGDMDDLIDRLHGTDPALALMLREWAEIEGSCATDYDVAAPTVGEIPGLTLQLVRGALASPGPAGQTQARYDLGTTAASLPRGDRERLMRAWEGASAVYGIREDNVRLVGLAPLGALRRVVLEMGRRSAARGVMDDADDAMMLSWPELANTLGDHPADHRPLIARRSAEAAWVRAHPGPMRHGPAPQPPPDLRGLPVAGRLLNEALIWAMGEELAPPRGDGSTEAVTGTPCGTGRHTGPVRIVRDASDFDRVTPGDVLVCPIATPAWAPLFGIVGAVVCDGGGPLSHTAIVAREHGLPAIVGAIDATTSLVDGQLVTVDGAAGTVTVAT